MIRVSNEHPKAMEFTSFKQKEGVTDDELIRAAMAFESEFLTKQPGVIFHCLVRNFSGDYANVLFAKTKEDISNLEKAAHYDPNAGAFFGMIDMGSVKMTTQSIEKDFSVPAHFSCVEYGSFSLKSNDYEALQKVSESIERDYLSQFENTRAHFVGRQNENLYTEVTFGATLGKTKEVCMGYIGNPICQPLLDMADEKSMQLDFWYVIA
ncbi:hypothetical protein GCM10009122_59070 [Fulvivirga kasyanovii]|uniref:Uncharacterized protein n=1 Tax=Fulvivirga kasyanovii TaxID=396812 RepID=A0ABW9RM76_9BACT|nr:hypothetical protein [Fulvivirga kasyanovii]MTI25222.1 hypothetical protein [Fulvivirga kasyanovii]